MPESKALVWDQESQKLYSTGIEKVALFVKDAQLMARGVAWNGVSKVSENPSGAEPTKLYANNKKYLELTSAEEFGFTIEAYMSPVEFDECDGTKTLGGIRFGQQTRKPFNLAYITCTGNDTSGTDYDQVLHLVYGCRAKPTPRDNSTINDNPEAQNLSWECTTTPVDPSAAQAAKGIKPFSHVSLSRLAVGTTIWGQMMEKVYGGSADPSFPDVAYLDTVIDQMEEA